MNNASKHHSGLFIPRLAVAAAAVSLLALLGSCNLTGIFGTRLSPPDWIIGHWTGEEGNGQIEFTEDTVIYEEQDFSENRAADEIVSDSEYHVERPELDDGEQIDSLYKFKKQDDDDTLRFTYEREGKDSSSQLYYRSED